MNLGLGLLGLGNANSGPREPEDGINANTGYFSVRGQDAVLAGNDIDITADYGAFTLAGQDATLTSSASPSGQAYFSDGGGTASWYMATQPNAIYDSTGDKTWIAYEGWDGDERTCYMTLYNHASSAWEGPYIVGYSELTNDDHGVPSIIMDSDGYVHVFFGGHGNAVQHATTSLARDATRWRPQATLNAALTYPSPVLLSDGNIYVGARRTDEAGGTGGNYRMYYDYYISTDITDGVVTWASPVVGVDLDYDSRFYLGSHILQGGEVHFLGTRADFGDDERKHIYYYVYDPVANEIRNFADSTSTAAASLPINLTTSNASYRIFEHTGSNVGNLPRLAFDSSGNPHIIFTDGANVGKSGTGVSQGSYQLKHVWHNGTSWQTPESISGAVLGHRNDNYSIKINGSDQIEVTYIDEATPDDYRHGDVYKVVRSNSGAGGTWGSASLIQEADSSEHSLSAPMHVKDGDAELDFIFQERSSDTHYDAVDKSSDTKTGYMRLFAYGSSGLVRRDVLTNRITLTNTTVNENTATGETIAEIISDNARDVHTITSDPDSKFSISGNKLSLSATVNNATKSSHALEITSTVRGVSVVNSYTINVEAGAFNMPSSCVIDIDASQSACYPGSGQSLTNLVSGGSAYNYHLGTTHDAVDAYDPNYNANGYFEFDGTEVLEMTTLPGASDFLSTLHKQDGGSNFWHGCLIRFTSGISGYPYSFGLTTMEMNGNRFRPSITAGGLGNLFKDTSFTATTNTWYACLFTYSHDTGIGRVYSNSITPTFTKKVFMRNSAAHAYSLPPSIGGYSFSFGRVGAGTEIAGVYAGNEFLYEEDALRVMRLLEARHSLTLT